MLSIIIIGNWKGKLVNPDGTLKDILRQDWGYWESKDESDDLDVEIAKKFEKGYPNDNILFEDSREAVLYQDGVQIARIRMHDEIALDTVLKTFINFQRPEVAEFRKAIELFKNDIPKVTEALRQMIETDAEQNKKYIKAMKAFLELCKEVINPSISKEDIREMVIQHILTADIFNTIFDEPNFHRENNIAKELNGLVETFFTKDIRNRTLAGIKHYYDTINARAAQIADHHEKQKFLKIVYETFYKSYDPKKADRLGVIYTPNEIVRFMIESTDYLLGKHFGKQLEDKNVDILDPATGTGTFICDIIDYISKNRIQDKYRNELHANEVEILPYYIANLNIEFIYKQKTGQYEEFKNLCFVDTLDNMDFEYEDKQYEVFSVSDENTSRIRKQNEKKISVIIGNPPYNANQMNENENNKNREYPEIDKRIKDTYIKHSTAQKTKLYDMYSRFLRWASDRIDENGIIAFVSNNSFIDSKTFDGFRKVVKDEFNHLYIINLKGNARNSGERRRQEGGNIFHDQIKVGIAIYFLIKNKEEIGFNAYYNEIKDYAKSDEKLDYLVQNPFKDLNFEHIQPDKDNTWINQNVSKWDDFILVADKQIKTGKSNQAIFKLYSTGVSTNRDEWVTDISKENLLAKMKFFIYQYIHTKEPNDSIKWSRNLKARFKKQYKEVLLASRAIPINYRPFYKPFIYNSALYIDEHGLTSQLFNFPNQAISISVKSLSYLATDTYMDLHFTGDSQCLPLYQYDKDGNRFDNITDWALNEFKSHYEDDQMCKEDIFHYVYALLHDPAYRVKYEQNLKRSLPRIPFYEDFRQWAEWGKSLMELHIGFETVEPYPLKVSSVDPGLAGCSVKPKLKADKLTGTIELDELTSISGIPKKAWEYKLGNRSALEWILDQYKEKKPKDPTIAKLFNTYKFADYKDKVIDLILRVTTVSVETMKIVREMNRRGLRE